MSLNSNVPQLEFTDLGIVVPSSQEVLNGTLADINEAFNYTLSLSLDTPQGQIATSNAAIIVQKNGDIVYVVNQFDPRTNTGFFQDAIGFIYFLVRKPGSPTTVAINFTGTPGTIITAGTLIKDINNNTYAVSQSVTINNTGTVTGEAQNVVTGPIPCPANTLNIIFQSIPGWDTVNNPLDGILGTDVESRNEFENRRFQSVQKNSVATVDAIRGAVFEIIGIEDVLVIDNYESTSQIIKGVTLVANSIYISVYAPLWNFALEYQVALAAFTKKNPGCAYNGDTSVTVQNQGIDYIVKFQEASSVQIYFKVEIVNNQNLPGNIAVLIQNAIVNAFNEPIAALIEANKYYGPILATNPLVQIINVFVGTAPNPSGSSVQTTAAEKPLTEINNIIVELI